MPGRDARHVRVRHLSRWTDASTGQVLPRGLRPSRAAAGVVAVPSPRGFRPPRSPATPGTGVARCGLRGHRRSRHDAGQRAACVQPARSGFMECRDVTTAETVARPGGCCWPPRSARPALAGRRDLPPHRFARQGGEARPGNVLYTRAPASVPARVVRQSIGGQRVGSMGPRCLVAPDWSAGNWLHRRPMVLLRACGRGASTGPATPAWASRIRGRPAGRARCAASCRSNGFDGASLTQPSRTAPSPSRQRWPRTFRVKPCSRTIHGHAEAARHLRPAPATTVPTLGHRRQMTAFLAWTSGLGPR